MWLEPGKGGAYEKCPTSFMLRRSEQSITEMPPHHHAPYMRLARITGGPCNVTASSCGAASPVSPSPSVFIHGRPHWLRISGLVGSLMSSVQITRLFQPGALFGRNASLRLLSTPKRCGPVPG